MRFVEAMRSLIKKTRSGFSSSGNSTRENAGNGSGPGGKNNLKIDVGAAEAEHDALKKSREAQVPATPLTVSSASSYPATPTPIRDVGISDNRPPLRDEGDVRSPGVRETPLNRFRPQGGVDDDEEDEMDGEDRRLLAKKVDDEDGHEEGGPVPDFITQTDRYGNATTPRSSAAIQSASQQSGVGVAAVAAASYQDSELVEAKTAESGEEYATETIFDSLRVMCCCLLLDDPGTAKTGAADGSKDSAAAAAAATAPRADGGKRRPSPSSSAAPEPPRGLLPDPTHPDDVGKKCLVLDLDETLVHSSFRAVPGADFVIPVQVEDVVHSVYVAKRPHVDDFLLEMSKYYEIVIYTASLDKYADPLLDLLDVHKVIRFRLFRESCVFHEGHYVKDLSLLNRDLHRTIIVDNSPNSYIFHPENAIDCTSFIDDTSDAELKQIGDFLKGVHQVDDVRHFCNLWRGWPNIEVEQINALNGGGLKSCHNSPDGDNV